MWCGVASKSANKVILCSDKFEPHARGSLGPGSVIVVFVVTALCPPEFIIVMCVLETKLVFSTPWEHGGVISAVTRGTTDDGLDISTDVAFRARVESALLLTRPFVFDTPLPSPAFRGKGHTILQEAVEGGSGRAPRAAAAVAAAATAAAAVAADAARREPASRGTSKDRRGTSRESETEPTEPPARRACLQFEVGDYVEKRDGTVLRIAEELESNSAKKVRKASPSLTPKLPPRRGARLYAERLEAEWAAAETDQADKAKDKADRAKVKAVRAEASAKKAHLLDADKREEESRNLLLVLQNQLGEERRRNERLQQEKFDAASAAAEQANATTNNARLAVTAAALPNATEMEVDAEFAACLVIMKERALARQQHGQPQLKQPQQPLGHLQQ